MAAFTDDDRQRLLEDSRIVRNRLKIDAAIGNARALLALHADGRRLSEVIAAHTPPPRDRPLTFADVPSQTPESVALSKELKRLGFRFVGPTTMYALLQAIGAVDDHVQGCWLARP